MSQGKPTGAEGSPMDDVLATVRLVVTDTRAALIPHTGRRLVSSLSNAFVPTHAGPAHMQGTALLDHWPAAANCASQALRTSARSNSSVRPQRPSHSSSRPYKPPSGRSYNAASNPPAATMWSTIAA